MKASRGKKLDIERAAISLFAQKGSIAATIKEIARAAGVTDGAIYRHYESKDALCWALFTRELGVFMQGFAPLLQAPGLSVRQRIRDSIAYLVRYNDEHPEAFGFILLAKHSFPPELLIEAKANPMDMLADALHEAMLRGEIEARPSHLLAAMLMGMVLHPLELFRYREQRSHGFTDPEMPKVLADSALRLLGPEPDTRP